MEGFKETGMKTPSIGFAVTKVNAGETNTLF